MVGNTYAKPNMLQSNFILFPLSFGPVREQLIKFYLALCMQDSCTLAEKLKSGHKYTGSIYVHVTILKEVTPGPDECDGMYSCYGAGHRNTTWFNFTAS